MAAPKWIERAIVDEYPTFSERAKDPENFTSHERTIRCDQPTNPECAVETRVTQYHASGPRTLRHPLDESEPSSLRSPCSTSGPRMRRTPYPPSGPENPSNPELPERL